MLILGYLAQTLRRPLPIRKAGPCAPWPMRPTILSHYRKIGVGPIGDRAAQLLLDLADPPAQLALFYDRQLNLKMPPRRDLNIRARVITRRLPIINSSDTSQ
jgi:hypothetical protein